MIKLILSLLLGITATIQVVLVIVIKLNDKKYFHTIKNYTVFHYRKRKEAEIISRSRKASLSSTEKGKCFNNVQGIN